MKSYSAFSSLDDIADVPNQYKSPLFTFQAASTY